MLKVRPFAAGFAILFVMSVLLAGCVSVKAPESISIGDHPHRIDSSRVPPTQSHEEARQLLGETYERNRYLEAKVAELEREKKELKQERDEYKRRYKGATD
jgi:predicted RNase H-like nuclease (RuvC/YqgF family)